MKSLSLWLFRCPPAGRSTRPRFMKRCRPTGLCGLGWPNASAALQARPRPARPLPQKTPANTAAQHPGKKQRTHLDSSPASTPSAESAQVAHKTTPKGKAKAKPPTVGDPFRGLIRPGAVT